MSAWKALFGPSFRECWRDFSDAAGGAYEETGFWGEPRVTFRHGPFTITLKRHVVSTGKSSITYTRFRAAYCKVGDLQFRLYRAGLLSPIATYLGAQNLNIGNPSFDQAFVLKGNDLGLLARLFEDDQLRRKIATQASPRIELCPNDGWFCEAMPQGEAELRYVEQGLIKDTEHLQSILDLMKHLLDRLCEIGVAKAVAPSTVF